jgi:hypothetical protein
MGRRFQHVMNALPLNQSAHRQDHWPIGEPKLPAQLCWIVRWDKPVKIHALSNDTCAIRYCTQGQASGPHV